MMIAFSPLSSVTLILLQKLPVPLHRSPDLAETRIVSEPIDPHRVTKVEDDVSR
jgi:hypothetical protein